MINKWLEVGLSRKPLIRSVNPSLLLVSPWKKLPMRWDLLATRLATFSAWDGTNSTSDP